jgi:mannose-1-phosphate guanylyltransferase
VLCGLIIAGGKGERFWPLSTDEKPKQFLKLLGEETMLQMTVNRLQKFIPLERIFIATAQQYEKLINEQIPLIPSRNIIIEPVGRNTAPCIALSAFTIDRYYKAATLLAVPADHLITNENIYMQAVLSAYSFIDNTKDNIVTLGITPDRPETGYGYIKYSIAYTLENDFKIHKVKKFVEKPDKDTAQRYISDGGYLWNSGMFIWKTTTIIDMTYKYLFRTYKILRDIFNIPEKNYYQALYSKYKDIESISIDYGIMEKASNIYVIPCDFGWDDIGTWSSLERYRHQDENKNICVGNIRNFECNNNLIIGNEKPIVAIGLDDIFIIESDNIIFIGKKEHINRMKEIKGKVV